MKSVNSGHNAISSLIAVLVVIIIILAGVTAYSFSIPKSGVTSTETTTVVSTTNIGAGSIVTVTATASNSGSASAQLATLEQLSKQEGGQVTLYSTLDAGDWATYFAPALKQAFPWISVNFVGLTSATLVQKVTAECNAKNVVGDVITTAFTTIADLYNQGCVQSWNDTMEQFSGYSPGLIDPHGGYHVYTQNPIGLSYNTNIVTNTATLPKTWTDLANPIWKGKLCIDDPSLLNVAGGVFASFSYNISSSQWMSDLKSIAANNPTLTNSASQTFTYVESGQCAIGIDLGSDYLGRGNATNIGFTFPFNPIPIQGGALGIVKGTTHPYTSELVVEWFQSYSGQAATLASGRTPVLHSLAVIGEAGLSLPTYPTIANGGPAFISNATGFKSTYTSIFGP